MRLVRLRTLACLVIGASALLVPAAARATVNCAPDANWGTLDSSFEAQVAVQLNQQRAANGLGPLAVSPLLTDAAEWKSLHMSEYQYLDHADPAPPVDRQANQRIADCGYTYPTSIGEDIAQGFARVSDVVAAWMGSAGHRANILDTGFTVLGVGVARDAHGVYWWTVDFGGVADPGTVAVGTSPPTTAPTTAPPPVTTAPPTATQPAHAPVSTTPPATTAAPVTPTTALPTTKEPATVDTTAPEPAPSAGGSGLATDIAGAVTRPTQLVVKRDVVWVRAGQAKVLHPLRNDLDPEGAPLHLVRILEQPPGSHARILHGDRTIRLRLARRDHGKSRLVYLVSTASGVQARGVVELGLKR